VLLCTHYMDEADRLCDRLAIIDHGKIVALGTPRELKSGIPGQEMLTAEFSREIDEGLLAAMKGLPEVREAARDHPHVAHLILHGDEVPLDGIIEAARAHGNRVKSLTMTEPTLEDVFIYYTGRGLRDSVAEGYNYAVPNIMR
jgi:ABC-2 type transport system ATP-binding protein